MQLHPRTSTPKISTVLRDFLAAHPRCVCCTVRVVLLDADRDRAVVEWGAVPYITARGRPASLSYYTSERASDLRPEVLRTYSHRNHHNRCNDGDDDERDGREQPDEEWVRDRLRDSWLVEQLAYWVEYLEEWKFLREWYVYRAELFEGRGPPDVLSPGCQGCVVTHRPDGMRRRASSCA